MQIPRIDNLTSESFEVNYINKQIPIILCGIATSWPAISKWSFDYLRSTIGSREVTLSSSKTGIFHLESNVPRKVAFDESLTLIEHPVPETPERIYLSQLPLEALLPELTQDISVPSLIQKKTNRIINLWIGQKGNVSPLHNDASDNLLVQVKGKKRLVLFSSDEYEYLYAKTAPGVFHMSQINLDSPDLTKFPSFKNAKRMECVLEPGEILFIPAFWWHQVYTLDLSISVNFWWPTRVQNFMTSTGCNFVAHFAEYIDPLFPKSRIEECGFGDLLSVASCAQLEGRTRFAILCGVGAVKHSIVCICKELEIPVLTENGASRTAVELHNILLEKSKWWKEHAGEVSGWLSMQQSAISNDRNGFDNEKIALLLREIGTFVAQAEKARKL